MDENFVKIEELLGKVFTEIGRCDNCITFKISDNENFEMFHAQNCCEDVYIEDICGDLNDLLNTPIIKAFEKSNLDETPKSGYEGEIASCTWTFYTLVTIKGSVTIRWYGESNGCYAEDADIFHNKE